MHVVMLSWSCIVLETYSSLAPGTHAHSSRSNLSLADCTASDVSLLRPSHLPHGQHGCSDGKCLKSCCAVVDEPAGKSNVFCKYIRLGGQENA